MAPGEGIAKGLLFSYHDIYRLDGGTRIGIELEKTRKAMETRYHELLKEYGSETDQENEKMFELLTPLKIEVKQNLRLEIINSIIARNLTNEKMNPSTHIPFKNGLLNIETHKLEPFTKDLFFTFQVDANYLEQYVRLTDTPMFWNYLNQVFYEPDIPMVLSYFGYAFYPGFPAHKVLFILGRERIGKGTGVRLLRGLIPDGYGSVQLDKLLISERFMFTGIIGKNILVDAEIKKRFRRGTVRDFKHFNELFGGDAIQYELKGHEARDYISQAKGIFIGNLPFFDVDNPAAANRILLVETRNEKPKRVIPELDVKILDKERDKIATLLMQVLFKLKDRDFLFPGEMTAESTMEQLDRLADPVENFIEEMTESMEGSEVSVEDAYDSFKDWCIANGIPPLAPQSFKKKFGYSYPKKLRGKRSDRKYVFTDCNIFGEDIEVKTQELIQVEHGGSIQGTLKNRLSYDRFRRVQHACIYPSCTRKEKDHVTCIKYSAQKLNTTNSHFKTPENKGSRDTKSVFNLDQKPKMHDLPESLKTEYKPTISYLQKERPVMASIDSGLKDLEKHGFSIMETMEARSANNEWKVKLRGKFSTYTSEQQEYLSVNFSVKFDGTDENPYTVAHFTYSHSVNVPDTIPDEFSNRIQNMVNELTQEGYNVLQDHGFSSDKTSYLISIAKEGAENRFEVLEALMGSYEFAFRNYQKKYGYLFTKELQGDVQ